MNPCKNQIDENNGFDFISKINGSIIYEQACNWFFSIDYSADFLPTIPSSGLCCPT